MQKLHTRTTAGLMLKTETPSLAIAVYLERSLYPERKIRVVDLIMGKAWLADSCQLNQRRGSNLLFLACRAKQHRAPASPRIAVSIALVLVLPKGPGACLVFASPAMLMPSPAFFGTVGSRLCHIRASCHTFLHSRNRMAMFECPQLTFLDCCARLRAALKPWL